MLRSAPLLILLLLLPAVAGAQLFPALTDTDTFSGFGFGVNTTRGWQFSVSDPLQVEQLGFWDSGLDGLAVAHPVGIWLDDATLLTSATVPAGTAATLDGTFRWVTTSPVVLQPGNTYVIGAFWPISSGDTRLRGGENPIFDPRVSLTGGRSSTSNFTDLAFPSLSGALELNANFKAIPAPSPPVPAIHPIVLYTVVTGLLIGTALTALRKRD